MKIQVSDANSIFHSYIDIIISASNRAAGLITKLLAFARKGKYQVVLVDLNQVIGNVVKLLDHSLDKRIVIKRERLYAEATVLGDPTQLENAVLNLALNARDAMPDGGTLEFSTAMADSANSSLPELVAGRYVLLRVRDDGMGMDKAVQAKIFEPFFTTKPIGKGTGLGLASVYGTVSNHQGRIEVESAPGRGACFSIYLPYIKQQADRKNKKPLKFKRQSGTILFVDDEELIRTVGAESLRAFGYDVVLCKNGSEAMAYYKKHPTSTDIVMLDLMMPKMSGQDCLRRMKAINPAQRAIIMSGHSVEKEPHELNDFKDVDYIQKPFDLQRLYTVLQKTIKD